MADFVMKWPHPDTNSKTASYLGSLQEKNESVHLLSLISPITFLYSNIFHLLSYHKLHLNNENIGFLLPITLFYW